MSDIVRKQQTANKEYENLKKKYFDKKNNTNLTMSKVFSGKMRLLSRGNKQTNKQTVSKTY